MKFIEQAIDGFLYTLHLVWFAALRMPRGLHAMERRKRERRAFNAAPNFPLLTLSGRIVEDRRRQPDRRLNNIKVMFLGIASCTTPNG